MNKRDVVISCSVHKKGVVGPQSDHPFSMTS